VFGALLVFVLALIVTVGCGGSNPPSSPEKANSVVVRISGTQGTAYVGDYGTFAQEPQTVDDTLGSEPKEYEVKIQEGALGVSASFQKTQPGAGELKAEILADGQVVTESTTYAEFGSVIVEWLPQVGVPPDEFLPGESTVE
jgi:hypothetical protein